MGPTRPTIAALLALLSAAACGVPSLATAGEFSAPSPNLLYQLQKENQGRPWLRVTTDSSRLDLRARRIDAVGLDGITPQRARGSAPERIAWASIARIDRVETRATFGGVTGLIVCGAVGAGLGNAIGAGMTHEHDSGAGYTVSDNSGGTGALIGLIALGGLGAWAGARLGGRIAHERPWYTAAPAVVAATTASPDSPATPPEGAAPSPSLANLSRDLSGSRAVRSACARIATSDLLRVRGDFGLFQGYASVIGPQGVEGLRIDPHGPSEYVGPPPSGRVSWDRIDFVDKRGSAAGRGALIGGVSFALIGGVIGAAFAVGFDAPEDAPAAAAVVGGVTGGVGLLLGALMGAAVPAWHNVYDGP